MKFFNKKAPSDLGPGIGRHRSFIRRIGRDPKVDWVLSVIFCFIVLIIFIVVGAKKYLSYDEKVKEQVTSTKIKDSGLLDTGTLDSVFNRYDERAKIRGDLIKSYNGTTDPSI